MNATHDTAAPAHGTPSALPRRLHVVLKAELAELAPLAEAVDAFAADLAWDDALGMRINLVLEELIVNIISYGYPDGRGGHIEVWLEAEASEIRLRVEDDGDAFDPFAQAAPDLSQDIETRPIGGLGVYFVRSYMDSCTYCHVDGRNQVTLTKQLH